MVGGTQFHRRVIQREISKPLLLNLLWPTLAVLDAAQEISALDNAFALIEGHPPAQCASTAVQKIMLAQSFWRFCEKADSDLSFKRDIAMRDERAVFRRSPGLLMTLEV